jgi:CRISPR-associated protein Csx10
MTTYQLRYRIKLEQEVVFRITDGDPNLVQSDGYIPGSAIWGSLARLAAAKLPKGYNDERFSAWFLDDGLRCLNAYLCERVELEGLTRLLPAPLSFRHEKGLPEVVYDFAAYWEVAELPPAPKKLERSYLYLKDEIFCSKISRTHYNYHHKRQSRRKGRATAEGGSFFVYEALESGQLFEGLILGEEADLTAFCTLLGWTVENPLKLNLGRSKTTQYGGGGQLHLIEEPEAFTSEAPFRLGPASYLVVTLTSPLLVQDANGYPGLEFPHTVLSDLLGIPIDKPARSFKRSLTVGGYSAAWQLPRPQWPAIAAGSVFVFRLNQPLPANYKEAEATSLGLRTGEGFGRFVLNWHGSEKMLDKEAFEVVEAKEPFSTPPVGLTDLIKRLVTSEWLKQAEGAALQDAERFGRKSSLDHASTALLGRLQLVFRRMDSLEKGQKFLEQLKKPARQQLELLRNQEAIHQSLYDLLKAVLALESLYDAPLRLKEENLAKVTAKINWQAESDGDLHLKLVRHYLITLLSQLARKRRLLG